MNKVLIILFTSSFFGAINLLALSNDSVLLLINDTGHDLLVQSSSLSANPPIDRVIKNGERLLLHTINDTGDLVVKKVGRNPFHPEHKIDIQKIKDGMYEVQYRLAIDDIPYKGLEITVQNKIAGTGISLKFDGMK